jgi:hypothetical protein
LNRLRWFPDRPEQVPVSENTDGDIATYIYDERGNRLNAESRNSTYIYTYDERGNVLTMSQEVDHGWAIDKSWVWTYDENDNLLREESFSGSVLERVVSYAYDCWEK